MRLLSLVASICTLALARSVGGVAVEVAMALPYSLVASHTDLQGRKSYGGTFYIYLSLRISQ
jgi:hypothetical protein